MLVETFKLGVVHKTEWFLFYVAGKKGKRIPVKRAGSSGKSLQ